jgi:4-amino-4-deoxy-L-arabinose transferase-like glycosyltransferase
MLCLWATLAAAGISTVVFERLPHVEDEVAFLFQARTYAAGRLVAPAPPLPEFFSIPFVIVRDGAWFGKYPPGYPLVLALGVLVDRAWLVNPLAAGLAVALTYLLGRRVYGARTGLLAALLLATSPFLLIQAGSFLSHVVCLAWTLLFLLGFEVARCRGAVVVGVAAGAALGMVLLSRPLTAVGVSLPFAVWAGVESLRCPARLRVYAPMGAATLVSAGLLLGYNWLTTGHPLLFAYQLWWPFDRIGFGAGISPDGHHTVWDGWLNTRFNLSELESSLFGWPFRLSLAPVLLALLVTLGCALRVSWQVVSGRAGTGMGEAARWDLALGGLVLSLVAVHAAYWAGGQMYGPRYYFEASGALALLAARGLREAGGWFERMTRRVLGGSWAGGAIGVGVPLAFLALLVSYGLFWSGPRWFVGYQGWYGVTASGLRTVEAARLENAIVFVRAGYWTDYAPFFVQNSPLLDGRVIYALDLGAEQNRRLAERYPERALYAWRDGSLVPLETGTGH